MDIYKKWCSRINCWILDGQSQQQNGAALNESNGHGKSRWFSQRTKPPFGSGIFQPSASYVCTPEGNSSKYPIKYPSSHQWIITINIYWAMNFPWNILTTNVPWSFPWNIGKSHDFQQADNSDTSAELARLRGVAGVSVDCASGLALRKRMAKKLSSMFHWLLFKLTIPPYGCRIYLQSNSWPWHRCQVPWKKTCLIWDNLMFDEVDC